MPRVYANDYQKYFHPTYTFANKTGDGLGNEYFKRMNYSTMYNRAQVNDIEGNGIFDTVLTLGKTAIDFTGKNKELLSAIGNIASATSQISRASESAKQLEAIKRIQQIRELNQKDENRPNDNSEVKKQQASVTTTKANKIINDFKPGNSTGRGLRKKKGGTLKSF